MAAALAVALVAALLATTLAAAAASELDQVYLSHLRPQDRLLIRGTDYGGGDCSTNTSRRTLDVAGLLGLVDRSARLVEVSGYAYLFDASEPERVETLATLFFPLDQFGQMDSVERALESGRLEPAKFALEVLNLSRNGLADDFLDGYSYGLARPSRSSSSSAMSVNTLLIDFFGAVRLLQLSHNSLRHLDRRHFGLFVKDQVSKLEVVLLDHNGLLTIRHDTFYDLTRLRHLDVSSNRLKVIHPFTFTMCAASLVHLDVSHNRLQALYKTTPFQLTTNESLIIGNETAAANLTTLYQQQQYQEEDEDENTLTSLKRLRLAGNRELRCDCGLLWLFKLQARQAVMTDNFTCKYEQTDSATNSSTFRQVSFGAAIGSEQELMGQCRMPNLVVNVDKLKETSTFEFFRWVSRSWFNWAVFPDYMPPIIPFPYLSTWSLWPSLLPPTTPVTTAAADNETTSNETETRVQSESNKHIFFTWRMSDVTFDCEDELTTSDDLENANATSSSGLKSAIIWKTQYGYFSYLDHGLAQTFRKEINASRCTNQTHLEQDEEERKGWERSFQIFYKMNKLTKIYQNMSVLVSSRFGTQSVSELAVDERSRLKITNIRKVVAGPIVCIALNARGIRTYEFAVNMRSGIGENFIYSLFISLVAGIVPSLAGIVICCYCEYEADKNYPMTPPCYPTPLAATPPNFDINEWMSNAASYLPNLPNISETLEQVSKKLRKGMEKASVTVKSLGLTSSAYIYSVYEQSSQRFQDMRSYVPNINVPTLTMPTMRYPPMGDLAQRMRLGMGNMFIHFKEFCGTSDLTHTPSIIDIEADTNASSAVGRAYIIDQINLKRQQNTHYRFLNFIREESKRSQTATAAAAAAATKSAGVSDSSSGDSSSSSTPTTSGLTAPLSKLEVQLAVAQEQPAEPGPSSPPPLRGKDSSGINVYVRTSQTKYDDDVEDYDDDEVYKDDDELAPQRPPTPEKEQVRQEQL